MDIFSPVSPSYDDDVNDLILLNLIPMEPTLDDDFLASNSMSSIEPMFECLLSQPTPILEPACIACNADQLRIQDLSNQSKENLCEWSQLFSTGVF